MMLISDFVRIVCWLFCFTLKHGNAFRCLSCTDIEEYQSECHKSSSCFNGEVCYIDKYKVPWNTTGLVAGYGVAWGDGTTTKFEMGCTSPSLCAKDTTSHFVGKRYDHERNILCRDCCNTDNCNNKRYACNTEERNVIQYMTCRTCEGIDDPRHCTTSFRCAQEKQVCYIHKYRTDTYQIKYDLGCAARDLCLQGTTHTVGRRSGKHLMCESCCSGHDNCNANLNC